MKTLVQKITVVIGLTVSLGLASCEKDSLLTPNPAGSARSGAANDDIVVGMPQVHKLTKYGDATLTYAGNGKLMKVTTPVSGSLAIETDYTYSPGTVKAFTHQGKIVLRNETFTLDASGRCTESVVEGFYSDTEWKYNYTAKGQLWSCTNKNSCVGGINYTYNADGDMILAELTTDAGGGGTDVTFAYSQRTVAGLLNDNYPVNLNVPKIPAHDAYLRIFGKPSKHLVQRVSYESPGSSFPVPSDRFYTYTLDADGYVKQRSMSHTLGGNSVENTAYEYTLADIGLSF